MKKEKSCGIVVFNKDKVLVIKHNKGHYGFPKGHVEDNETEHETAIREVKEETNIDATIIGDFREVITYSPKEKVLKDVVYFLGIPTSFNIKCQEEEVSKALFIDYEMALNLITHDDERNVLKKAIKYYKEKR
ncbi:MAG: NUDIX domain-containing protein [Bacilli bacterium]|nr:NUDIX domain-containing protein [Bacilli bacterium]